MLLIDADSLVYKAGWSVEKRYYQSEASGKTYRTKAEAVKEEGDVPLLQQTEVSGPPSHAYRCLDLLYKSVLEPFDRAPFVSYLSGPNNFRNNVAVTKPYKGNRPAGAKPFYYDVLREAICDRFVGRVVDHIEADDRLSIDANQNPECFIIGIDKDLLQIPGVHYNYDKKVFTEITEETGWYNFFVQVLTGDVSDNIPGLTGVGPHKAKQILESCNFDIGAMYEQCLKLYQGAYEGRDRFDETCELLYLLRYEGDCWSEAREWLRALL